MATSYPTSLDTFPTVTDNVDDIQAAHYNALADALVAVQSKIGIDSSGAASSIDYKLRHLPSQDTSDLVTNLNAQYLNGLQSTDFFPAQSGDWLLSSNSTTPDGWTNISTTYSNHFIRINSTPLSTGGADTHSHTVSTHTHTYSGNTGYASESGATNGLYAGARYHYHAYSGTTSSNGSGTSSTVSNVPVYVTAILFQKD